MEDPTDESSDEQTSIPRARPTTQPKPAAHVSHILPRQLRIVAASGGAQSASVVADDDLLHHQSDVQQ